MATGFPPDFMSVGHVVAARTPAWHAPGHPPRMATRTRPGVLSLSLSVHHEHAPSQSYPLGINPHKLAIRGYIEYVRIIFGAGITQWEPSRVPNPNPTLTQRGTQPKANRKPITNIFRGWVSEPNPYPVGTQWVMGHGIKQVGSMPKPQKLKKTENPPQAPL